MFSAAAATSCSKEMSGTTTLDEGVKGAKNGMNELMHGGLLRHFGSMKMPQTCCSICSPLSLRTRDAIVEVPWIRAN